MLTLPPVNYLSFVVFSAGVVTLGMELSAARLLEPVFGNNQIVWASLIGLILLYLAVGAWLGGMLADRYPHRLQLDLTVTIAAVGVACIPLFSTPVLRLAAGGLASFATGLLGASLLAILLLFSIPGVLLGTVSPWAIRLSLHDVEHSGQTAGRYYAIATAGSLLGTFLPVLWLIPAFGTRWTFFILALLLLAVLSLGSLRQRHRWIPLTGFIIVLLLAISTQPGGAIRAGTEPDEIGAIIYEDESVYNYIAVRQWGAERHLKLNDGIGIHSVYHPEMLLSNGIWDYFLLAPLFQPGTTDFHNLDDVLLIGLAAGTVSELLTDIYGPIPITGIELDPQIIAVGRSYFDMNQPNLTAIAADGRHWLQQQPDDVRWSMIAVDAYRPPYIPFHLTTVEFFQTVYNYLEDDGIVAINVGRTDSNFALVDAMTATLAEVFPSVYVIDEPGPPDTLANSLVVATRRPTTLDDFYRRSGMLPDTLPPAFRDFVREAGARVRTASVTAGAPVFTDDRAPIERVVHEIILDYLIGTAAP